MGIDPFRRRIVGLATILLGVALVSGCGWHLRGSYNFPAELTPIAVNGNGVGSSVRDSLRVSEVLARSDDDAPASRVEILEESQKRRVLSVDADGKVDEYEVRYAVRWQLTARGSGDQSRRILIAPLTFRANRSYDYDSGSVLSKSEEEDVLLETMRDDIAQRILFRLQGWQVGQNESPVDENENDPETSSSNG